MNRKRVATRFAHSAASFLFFFFSNTPLVTHSIVKVEASRSEHYLDAVVGFSAFEKRKRKGGQFCLYGELNPEFRSSASWRTKKYADNGGYLHDNVHFDIRPSASAVAEYRRIYATYGVEFTDADAAEGLAGLMLLLRTVCDRSAAASSNIS